MSVLRGFFPREEESSNAQYAHGVQDLFRKGIKMKMQQQKVSSVFLAQLTVYLLDTGVNDTLIDKIYGVMLALSRVLCHGLKIRVFYFFYIFLKHWK